jgi:hypothetical protein
MYKYVQKRSLNHEIRRFSLITCLIVLLKILIEIFLINNKSCLIIGKKIIKATNCLTSALNIILARLLLFSFFPS